MRHLPGDESQVGIRRVPALISFLSRFVYDADSLCDIEFIHQERTCVLFADRPHTSYVTPNATARNITVKDTRG